jgi:hypothetical protein
VLAGLTAVVENMSIRTARFLQGVGEDGEVAEDPSF